jgi:acetolactate synthase small subunit
MMTSAQTVKVSTFQSALDTFKARLSQEDRDEITYTTLEGLQRCIVDIQEQHVATRKPKNLARLSGFLEVMEQYSKVIEVFLNVSSIVCFVWVWGIPLSSPRLCS